MASSIPEPQGRFRKLYPRVWEAVVLTYHPKYRMKAPEVARHMNVAKSTVATYLTQAQLHLGLQGRHELEQAFWNDSFVDATTSGRGDPTEDLDLDAYHVQDCAKEPCPINFGGSPPCRRADCPLVA